MRRIYSILVGALCLSTALSASAAGDRAASSTNPPISVWKDAPAFFSESGSGRTALTDAAPPMPFIPLVPCRQYDSRSVSALLDNTSRTVTLSGAPCGIPTSAKGVAVNITVFNISGAGSNGVFKVGTAAPPTTAWINYPFNETQRANAGVLPTGASASIVVQVNQGAGSVDFVVDVFGYYGPTPATASNYFTLNTNSGGYTMYLTNSSTSCGGPCGLYQSVGSGIAIEGTTSATTGIGDEAIYGVATNAMGVKGLSTNTNGIWAESTNFDAFAAFGGREGAFIQGARNGAIIATTSTTGDTSGVYGTDGAGASGGLTTGWFSAGVRGFGKNGVIGVTSTSGGDGVVGAAISPATTAVIAYGNFSATGSKAFIEPHPSDPSKIIRYLALEGPEAGTYFRGTARTVNHEAVIEVPETFRIVSAEEGLTVQLTPVGGFAQMAVMSQDLNRIVVQSTRDITFHYHVNGVRRAFQDWQVVAEGREFRPGSPDQKMPGWLTEEAKSRLIANGTYNPDGTVNMSTAERMGWAQTWRDDAARAKAEQEAGVAAAKAAYR